MILRVLSEGKRTILPAFIGFKKHGPVEVWTIREKLSLGCSVMRNGDQNWVSVSRAVKLNAEQNRPPDWYSQKNCAVQYGDMLEKVETHKRKRGDKEISGAETPIEQIVRKLTIERIEEIRKLIQDEQQRYKKLKKDIELVKTGQLDDKLKTMWEEIQSSQKKKEPVEIIAEEKPKSTENVQQMSLEVKTEVDSDTESSTRDSMSDSINVETIDEKLSHPGMLSLKLDSLQPPANPDPQQVKPTPPPSPLLTTLLQSKQKSFLGLQQVKSEAEHEALMAQVTCATSTETVTEPVTIISTPSSSIKTSTNTVMTPPASTATVDTAVTKILTTPISAAQTSTPKMVTSTPVLEVCSEVNKDETDEDEDKTQPNSPTEIPASPISEKKEQEKTDEQEEAEIVEILSEEKDDETEDGIGFISVDEEVSIKEDPLSPASSVSSKFSESDSKGRPGRRRGKGRGSRGGRRNQRVVKKSNEDEKKDDASSKHSEAETSDIDEDSIKDDDGASQSQLSNPLLFSESLPSSPASLSHCSDTEDEKAFKTWKKSIMLVWRAAATHKYANVFLHPVTNDIAPGYLNIVHRPMNLTTIKRNLESGIIRTTSEFQRDMMLMFTNAIMYNSASHNVYKMAVEMYDDVLQHIEQYVSTQLMLQQSESKLLRTSRRTEASEKSEDDSKKRRQSADHPPDGGKSKKRKTRADD